MKQYGQHITVEDADEIPEVIGGLTEMLWRGLTQEKIVKTEGTFDVTIVIKELSEDQKLINGLYTRKLHCYTVAVKGTF